MWPSGGDKIVVEADGAYVQFAAHAFTRSDNPRTPCDGINYSARHRDLDGIWRARSLIVDAFFMRLNRQDNHPMATGLGHKSKPHRRRRSLGYCC